MCLIRYGFLSRPTQIFLFIEYLLDLHLKLMIAGALAAIGLLSSSQENDILHCQILAQTSSLEVLKTNGR